MYCTEETTCDDVGKFRRPHSDLSPGGLSPLPPRYSPDFTHSLPGGDTQVQRLLWKVAILFGLKKAQMSFTATKTSTNG